MSWSGFSVYPGSAWLPCGFGLSACPLSLPLPVLTETDDIETENYHQQHGANRQARNKPEVRIMRGHDTRNGEWNVQEHVNGLPNFLKQIKQ